MKQNVTILLLLINILAVKGQEDKIIVSFFDVENLYDTVNDESIDDDDYLPESDLKWNSTRYNKEIKDISNALSAFNGDEIPVIIGLAGIENKSVLNDLRYSDKLQPYGLQIVFKPGKRNMGNKWLMPDQIIVSYNLIHQEKGFSCDFESGKILNYERESADLNDDKVHLQTFKGNEYQGGTSGHLPVYVIFSLN